MRRIHHYASVTQLKRTAPLGFAQGHESFDLAQDRESFDITKDRESFDLAQDRELVERPVEWQIGFFPCRQGCICLVFVIMIIQI
jgi:hypothetical protein